MPMSAIPLLTLFKEPSQLFLSKNLCETFQFFVTSLMKSYSMPKTLENFKRNNLYSFLYTFRVKIYGSLWRKMFRMALLIRSLHWPAGPRSVRNYWKRTSFFCGTHSAAEISETVGPAGWIATEMTSTALFKTRKPWPISSRFVYQRLWFCHSFNNKFYSQTSWDCKIIRMNENNKIENGLWERSW